MKMQLNHRIWTSIQGRFLLLLLAVLVPILIVQAFIYRDRFEIRKTRQLQANRELAGSVAKNFEGFVEDVLHQEFAIGSAVSSLPTESLQDVSYYLRNAAAQYPGAHPLIL